MLFATLAERGIAPPLYGTIPGVGRLEGWVAGSRSLRASELSDPHLSRLAAAAMASFHQQSLPLAKTDGWLYRALRASLREACAVTVSAHLHACMQACLPPCLPARLPPTCLPACLPP